MEENAITPWVDIGDYEAMTLAMENMGVAVALMRLDGSLLFANKPFRTLHDYAAHLAPAGGFSDLVQSGALAHWNTDPARYFQTLVARLVDNGGLCRDQLEIGDRIIAVEDRMIEDRMILSVQQDITEQIVAARRLAYLASHDILTGLANRASVEAQLDRLTAIKDEGRGRFAVLIGDLDLFKVINDTHGHAAGDAVLQEMACRFRAVLGRNDFAARLGGDEFLFLCNDDDAPAANAERLAQQLIACADQPVVFEGKSLSLGISLGYCLFPDHGTQTAQLTRAADIALYRAKSAGRGRLVRFDQGENG
ncbi:diguanylate cyclase domain-containing protein [Agrobacterium vitis]